jgi:hypothetical protein
MSGLDGLGVAIVGDLDLVWLGLLGDRDGQPQNTGVVLESPRSVPYLARSGSRSGIKLPRDRPVASGLVHAEHAGPAIMYSLNPDHLAGGGRHRGGRARGPGGDEPATPR